MAAPKALPKKKFEVINWYEKWADGNKEDEIRRYPNEELLQIKLPMRAVLQGPTASGKTVIAINLLSGIGIWDKVVILAKNLDEFLYRKCIEHIQAIEKKDKRRILLAIDSIADLPPINSFSIKENTLLIVDDFVADDPKSLKPLEHIWLRGRKNGISPVFISQSYFDTPKMIRKNSDYVFIKKMGNPMDLKRILKEYELGATVKEITAMYERTQTGDVRDFFMVDRYNPDPRYRFRNGFEPFDE